MVKWMTHVLTENEIAIKAIEVISMNPGINTSELMVMLDDLFVLHPDDEKILSGRNDTYFSQKVRNLVSHYEGNYFGEHTEKGPKKSRAFTWTLNSKGRMLVKEKYHNNMDDFVIDELDNVRIQNARTYNPQDLTNAEDRKPETVNVKSKAKYKTDPRITKSYIHNIDYICEFNNNHITFSSKRTKRNYVEGHHLVPMKAQKDYKFNIDRSENVVSLCPVCHKQVHLGDKDERVKVLTKIYKLKLLKMNNIGLDISFEDLFNKYYS